MQEQKDWGFFIFFWFSEVLQLVQLVAAQLLNSVGSVITEMTQTHHLVLATSQTETWPLSSKPSMTQP